MSTKEINKQPVQNVEQEGANLPEQRNVQVTDLMKKQAKPDLSKLTKVKLIELIKNQYEEINALNSIVNKQDKKLNNLTTTVIQKQEELGDLRRSLINSENALKRERETVDTVNESIAKLEIELLQSNDNIDRLSLDLKTANESYTSLNTLRNQLESKLQSVTSSLDYFRKQSETKQKGNIILSVVIIIMAILWIIF